MVNSSGVWWASFLSLIICLSAGNGGLRAQELLGAKIAVSGSPALMYVQDLANGWDADDAKVRYLIEELITQRLEIARLSVELAGARAEAAEMKEVSRQQAALLTALMAVLARRDQQDTTSRSETTELEERLEAAQSELQRKHLENSQLAAELAAAHKAAERATMMALENLALIEAAGKAVPAAGPSSSLEDHGEASILLAHW